jgi:hypothetical protein
MTIHITPEHLEGFIDQIAKQAASGERIDIIRAAASSIRHLPEGKCICKVCGLSRVGYTVSTGHSDPGYKSCEQGCTNDNGQLVEVFTQADFDNDLMNASEADIDWLQQNFPKLMEAMEQRLNGELAGVI